MLILIAVAASTSIVILHACGDRRTWTHSILANPVALWLGRRSYGLYLYHRTLAILVPLLIPGIPLRVAAPLVIIASFVVAEISFRFVERPIIRAGRLRITRPEASLAHP